MEQPFQEFVAIQQKCWILAINWTETAHNNQRRLIIYLLHCCFRERLLTRATCTSIWWWCYAVFLLHEIWSQQWRQRVEHTTKCDAIADVFIGAVGRTPSCSPEYATEWLVLHLWTPYRPFNAAVCARVILLSNVEQNWTYVRMTYSPENWIGLN